MKIFICKFISVIILVLASFSNVTAVADSSSDTVSSYKYNELSEEVSSLQKELNILSENIEKTNIDKVVSYYQEAQANFDQKVSIWLTLVGFFVTIFTTGGIIIPVINSKKLEKMKSDIKITIDDLNKHKNQQNEFFKSLEKEQEVLKLDVKFSQLFRNRGTSPIETRLKMIDVATEILSKDLSNKQQIRWLLELGRIYAYSSLKSFELFDKCFTKADNLAEDEVQKIYIYKVKLSVLDIFNEESNYQEIKSKLESAITEVEPELLSTLNWKQDIIFSPIELLKLTNFQ